MGSEIAKGAIRVFPDTGPLYLTGAYHIRRSEGVQEALTFLKDGRHCLSAEQLFWFNVGCYECECGMFDEARHSVNKAVVLVGRFYELAFQESDLKEIHEQLYYDCDSL